MMRASTSVTYGVRSSPGVPRSSTLTSSEKEQDACRAAMTLGPNPSSPIKTFPSPMTRMLMAALFRSLHADAGDLASFRIERVDRAGQARVEGVHRPQDLQRLLRIGDRVADERRLVRPLLLLFVARAGVPGRGHDRLIVDDLPVPDDDPVRKRSA